MVVRIESELMRRREGCVQYVLYLEEWIESHKRVDLEA